LARIVSIEHNNAKHFRTHRSRGARKVDRRKHARRDANGCKRNHSGPGEWHSAAAGAGAIMWQMKRQREEAEQQHRKNVKADLQLDAYRDFQRAYAPLSDGWMPSSGLQAIRTAVALAISQLKAHGQQQPVLERTARFMQEMAGYTNKALALVFFIERYETLLPGFDIFRAAFGSALHDIREQTIPVQSALMKWLPLEHPNSTPLAPKFISCPLITEVAQAEIDAALRPLDIALSQLNCWAMDLSVDVERVKNVNVATIKSSTRAFVRPDSVASHIQEGFDDAQKVVTSFLRCGLRRTAADGGQRILRPTYADRIGLYAASF
jgi:hypothetical protein